MNATGAALVFSASFAALGLAGGYSEGISHALLGLALILPVGALAFWFGARCVRHEWHSALVSGVIAFAVMLETLPVVQPIPSVWMMVLAIDVAMAAAGFFLGRTPLFPKTTGETRS